VVLGHRLAPGWGLPDSCPSATIRRVSRPKLAVHGHFYQPERRDPWSGEIAPEPDAAPYRDWNARIDAECYKPNAERGNLRHISFDLGPTLASWLTEHDATTHEGFVDADLGEDEGPGAAAAGSASPRRGPAAVPNPDCSGHALAQAYHHSILPLASMADRRTEIRWGVRDFELRFGHRPTGIWLPETAVDTPTLRILAEEGIRYTILAPWQAADRDLDTRRTYRIDLGGHRQLAVVYYDAALSTAVSFDSGATLNADFFARDHVLPRLTDAAFSDGTDPLAVIATDGELYGHHQKFRDMFLARLVNPDATLPDRGFDLTTVGEAVCERPIGTLPLSRVLERTSWSCHHGVLRWMAECPDAADGRWKAPLRMAFERLAAAIDVVVERLAGDFMEPGAIWRARNDYVDVIFGAEAPDEFARRRLPLATPEQRRNLLTLLEAERWRLAMFASDGWFWGDPVRPETKHVMLCSARASRLVDAAAGTDLESRLVQDLSLLVSPSRRVNGQAIYNEALSEAGQPPTA
jgi:hypothetical protein